MPAYGYHHAVDPREVAGMAVLLKGLWEGTLATAPFKEGSEGPLDHAVPLDIRCGRIMRSLLHGSLHTTSHVLAEQEVPRMCTPPYSMLRGCKHAYTVCMHCST